MFYAKVNGQVTDPESATFVVRAREFGASAAQSAAMALQGAGTAAQTAAMGVNKGVRQGVYSSRLWIAPRLESAADYTTTTAAPKVSSALLVTARQVHPEDLTQKKGRSALTWSLLASAVLAAAGAVAALVWYRYNSTMTAETEEEEFIVTTTGGETTMTPAAGTEPAGTMAGSGTGTAESTSTGKDTGVNGRVSTSGW